MKQNIGLLNALMRMTWGFTLLAWATSRLVHRPYKYTFLMAAMMGAMKISEGVTRFCLMKAFLPKDKNTETSGREDVSIAADYRK